MKPAAPNPELTGERVILRKHELALAETMFNYVDRDRDRLGVFLPWVGAVTEVAHEEDFIKNMQKAWDDFTDFDYGIFEKSSRTYIGNIGVHTIRWPHDCCELGYWILGDFEGKGFISDAVRTLEKHLFEVGFHRIEIRCNSNNERSAAVPRRLGYKFEGQLREHMKIKSGWRDTLVFSKIVSD
jgi:RimJ/RimL family protein N-acetyltransferase